MNTLYADNTAKTLIAEWLEAKGNLDGWAAIKKEAETKLAAHYQKDFEQIVAALGDTTNLTTSVAIGDDLKVTTGNELKIDQPGAVEFLRAHPAMLGVLFKAKYEPISSAVVLSKLQVGDEIGTALAKVATFKPKTPGFSTK